MPIHTALLEHYCGVKFDSTKYVVSESVLKEYFLG